MYQRRRVELTEGSAEFEAAFMLSAKRRLAPERIDVTCTRIRELRENRDQLKEANIRVLIQEEIVFRKIAELFEQARARGYRTPHNTKHDRRFANGGEHEAVETEVVETEALSQGVIVGIVRERLDALLKVIPDTLEAVRERKQPGTGIHRDQSKGITMSGELEDFEWMLAATGSPGQMRKIVERGRAKMSENLDTLEKTIAAHAAMLADKEWNNEHKPILMSLWTHFELAFATRGGDLTQVGTLEVDGREIPSGS